eukprot:TRINITY_DN29301_c0_g1_i1.p1 TRINITY_DN29301_c0_g1~~TRINITY_DN29301_c0_g1_i1.p1  ORF type:complete len:368 (+),score=26.95 TRINITY_DN29301_c0_g1_i1:75-1178(+)
MNQVVAGGYDYGDHQFTRPPFSSGAYQSPTEKQGQYEPQLDRHNEADMGGGRSDIATYGGYGPPHDYRPPQDYRSPPPDYRPAPQDFAAARNLGAAPAYGASSDYGASRGPPPIQNRGPWQNPGANPYGSPHDYAPQCGSQSGPPDSLGYGALTRQSNEFFINLILDEHDRARHATAVAKQNGQSTFGAAGSVLGQAMGMMTGGHAVSDSDLAHNVAQAVCEVVPAVMQKQRWEALVSVMMLPPISGSGPWTSFMAAKAHGELFMAFRVHVLQRTQQDISEVLSARNPFNFFHACNEKFCAPEHPSYSRQTAHLVGPQIMDALRKRQPPLSVHVEIADAVEEVHSLCMHGLHDSYAMHAVEASRGKY